MPVIAYFLITFALFLVALGVTWSLPQHRLQGAVPAAR